MKKEMKKKMEQFLKEGKVSTHFSMVIQYKLLMNLMHKKKNYLLTPKDKKMLKEIEKNIPCLPYPGFPKDEKEIEKEIKEHPPGGTTWMAFRVNKGYGFCPEEVSPIKNVKGDKDYVRLALEYKIPAEILDITSQLRFKYYRRLYNIEEIRRSICFKGGVSMSFDMFKGIINPPKGVVPLPKKGERRVGGHTVLCIGYSDTKKLLKFMNSWGDSWGDNGDGYLSYEYIDKYLIEAWTSPSATCTLWPLHRMTPWKHFLEKFLMWVVYKITTIKSKKFIRGHKVRYSLKTRYSSGYSREVLIWVEYCWVAEPAIFLPERGKFTFVDFYINDAIVAWAHLGVDFVKGIVEIEDLFVMPEWRYCGIGSFALIQIIHMAKTFKEISKIVGWISIQDCLTKTQELIIRKLFKKKDFNLFYDDTRFIGSYLRAEKRI